MRAPLPLAAALTLIAAGAAADTLPPTLEEAGLAFRRPPSLEDMQHRFPYRAMNFSVWKGYALVACTSDAKGLLKCKALEEKPEGMGFGRAGEVVMNHVRVRSVDGGSPAGRTFRYGLKFGKWSTPKRYQPQGLEWARLPSFGDWNLTGMKMGDTWAADFHCVAHASGTIDCDLKNARPDNASFRKAASAAMAGALVAGPKGEAVEEGQSFDYTLKVMRLNWCGAGASRLPDLGAGQEAGTGPSAMDGGHICAAAIAITQ